MHLMDKIVILKHFLWISSVSLVRLPVDCGLNNTRAKVFFTIIALTQSVLRDICYYANKLIFTFTYLNERFSVYND